MDMRTKVRATGLTVVVVGTLTVGSAAALTYSWSWAPRYTDVSADNRTWEYRPPSAATGQKSVHELSARRDRGDDSKGRAEAARKTTFDPVQATGVRVSFFGRSSEADNDPVARLKVYVHCVGELESEWVLVGGKDVAPNTNSDLLQRSITTEDCPSQTVDGVMLQVLTGERGDRHRRTVYLERAELRQGGSASWTEDFTAP